MRYLTAGESHGAYLTAILDGMPAGLSLSIEQINDDLKQRQAGYGRGGRMQIESDQVVVCSGVRHGRTTGGPITLQIQNKDHQHWQQVMAVEEAEDSCESMRRVVHPRPGHADLVGGIKYGLRDLRDVLERASARETAIRVAIGSIAKQLLAELGVECAHHIAVFGGQPLPRPEGLSLAQIRERVAQSAFGILDTDYEETIRELIDEAKEAGDTLGGVVETLVSGLPIGLGSYVQWDKKLDAKLAQAVISINAFKGVEFGLGFEASYRRGSQVMDPILWSKEKGYSRQTNHLGGLEGGMTTGEMLIVRGAMKPIPTLYQPLPSVNIDTHEAYRATVERSDVTALPAAGVVMEAVVATVLAKELLATFPSSHMTELQEALERHRAYSQQF